MHSATLSDGTQVHCLLRAEALVLDHHVHGYLEHGVDIRDGDIVFDVGANIGLFGIRAVQRHRGVRVFAFEPVPAIHAVLKQNADTHGDGRLVALPYGLSSGPGHVDIDYFPNSPALSTAHAELWDRDPAALREAVLGNVKNAPPEVWYARFVPGFLAGAIAKHLRRGAQRIRCELRSVSQVMREQGLDRIDLLKVDCEGAELDVLSGIEDTDWARIDRVVTEVHDVDGRLHEVRALLQRHGFDRITVAREPGFEATPLSNVYAARTHT